MAVAMRICFDVHVAMKLVAALANAFCSCKITYGPIAVDIAVEACFQFLADAHLHRAMP